MHSQQLQLEIGETFSKVAVEAQLTLQTRAYCESDVFDEFVLRLCEFV